MDLSNINDVSDLEAFINKEIKMRMGYVAGTLSLEAAKYRLGKGGREVNPVIAETLDRVAVALRDCIY